MWMWFPNFGNYSKSAEKCQTMQSYRAGLLSAARHGALLLPKTMEHRPHLALTSA